MNKHGQHNKPTISFRASDYEREQINQRVKITGMSKQDYILRSCIYNKVCVVGRKETVQLIRSELKEMYILLQEVSRDFRSRDSRLTEDGLMEMIDQYQAFLDGMLWMLEGAKYLWEDAEDEWKL